MIRMIAAIDVFRGIADESGIPWNLPNDKEYYRKKVSKGMILMGYGVYSKHELPMHDRTEYVATRHFQPLREGFQPIYDIDSFLKQKLDIWVIGGSEIYKAALQYADELYITQVCGDFNCTKFFPSFESEFELVSKQPILEENGIEFQYQVWKRKKTIVTI